MSVVPSDWQQAAGSHQQVFGTDLDCSSSLLLVSIRRQRLDYLSAAGQIESYPVSTAQNGVGCEEGSGCTPYGWHEIAEKIGDGAECGTIFKGRVPNGIIARDLESSTDDDAITSRVLWLRGLQSGINRQGPVDSYQRYIYIHGTAQEHLIGKPVSHGCVRMKNRDVIALFDRVQIGDRVLIVTD